MDATYTVRAPRTIPATLQRDIIKLAALRSQIFRTAAEFKRLSAEINAKLAESVEVRP
jgi:hypothetical protein